MHLCFRAKCPCLVSFQDFFFLHPIYRCARVHICNALPLHVPIQSIVSGLLFTAPASTVRTCPHLQRTTIARADTSLYCVMDQWQHSLSQRLYERSLAGLRLRSNRTSILCCQPAGASLPAGNATRSTLLMKLRSALWWHTSLKA